MTLRINPLVIENVEPMDFMWIGKQIILERDNNMLNALTSQPYSIFVLFTHFKHQHYYNTGVNTEDVIK